MKGLNLLFPTIPNLSGFIWEKSWNNRFEKCRCKLGENKGKKILLRFCATKWLNRTAPLGFQYNITILTLNSIFWVEQFYLFPLKPTGAVLFFPFKNKWNSSFCSDTHSMAQFYLFRRTLGGAVLFDLAHIKWSSSNSKAVNAAQFYLFRCTFNEATLFFPTHN